jgi:hypothetical protein
VARYNIMESVYQQWEGMSLSPTYESGLIALCVHVLKYLVRIISLNLCFLDSELTTMDWEELESCFAKIMEADIASWRIHRNDQIRETAS